MLSLETSGDTTFLVGNVRSWRATMMLPRDANMWDYPSVGGDTFVVDFFLALAMFEAIGSQALVAGFA